MGGVQSGTHNLGEALWMQERQRQKCNREGSRFESHSAQSTQDRRKLLKRTRSLAVISEDDSKQDREAQHFRLGQSTFDLPRRHQLIPRAKLIDRNSLKDRLCKSQQHLSDSYERFNETRSLYSRSTCGLHSIPSTLVSLPDPVSLPYSRGKGTDPNRLNILDWPDPPRRYRSVQNLDTVSGLVDIVEDNWPIEGNRSIDCIYTQVKRKRKEHRSLDSILFEDDGELEYFDVLNLLPLSNVRLEYDDNDLVNGNPARRNDRLRGSRKLRALEYRDPKGETLPSTSGEASNEEACKERASKKDNSGRGAEENGSEKTSRQNSNSPDSTERNRRQKSIESYGKGSEVSQSNKSADQHTLFSSPSSSSTSSFPCKLEQGCKADVESFVNVDEEDRKLEEAEDYKSIWTDAERNEMSRRPQILKVVDNDVTKRRHRRSVVEIDAVEDVAKDKKLHEIAKRVNERVDVTIRKMNNNAQKTEDEVRGRNAENTATTVVNVEAAKVEDARNFFERKSAERETMRNKQNEGRFERIVKETSNILGKACSVVKGSLGFEARSESSDLGLGSESGSDYRRRSMDDGAEEDRSAGSSDGATNSTAKTAGEGDKKPHTNLTRSRSCVDSIECQDDGQEFDHVRYKIIKSHMFSKNMFNTCNDVTYEGLMQYLREYSFQELLVDNNVVIIEPVRAEAVERKPSLLVRTEPTCKIAGAIQKKNENRERNGEQSCDGSAKNKSTIRKHFFYHPIRVNRELIDEELPDPDTVKNVRQMFENTLKTKSTSDSEFSRDCKSRRSLSMKDLSSIDDGRYDDMSDKAREESRSRCSSRAKDLTRLFETKSISSTASIAKEELGNPRGESKTRILAQTFEARSGNTSPSDSNCSKRKAARYHHHHHHHHHHHQNWDSGSVSSGVSSDYPDTDAGSGAHCTSSDDEEVHCNDDDGTDARGPGHYVSQDVLKKIRECGTSVTYYGGKVVNMHNGPLISPLIGNGYKRSLDRSNDYVKFRLVKSNSCDSRLELTGRYVEGQSLRRGRADLRQCTIAETPSIEITTMERQDNEERRAEGVEQLDTKKREPPVVIGLEPKKEDPKEPKTFKADFKLGSLDDAGANYTGRFTASALTRWEVNTSNWKPGNDFGKMEFEEFEVLEDSLNGIDSQDQYTRES